MMKTGSLKSILPITAALALLGASARAGEIVSIDFSGEGEFSQLEISGDGPLAYDKQVNKEDKQVILDIKGAQLAITASRNLDTSSFNSRVSLVSPYQVDGGSSRVVVQLRENALADIAKDGNSIIIRIPNPGVPADTQPPPLEGRHVVVDRGKPEADELPAKIDRSKLIDGEQVDRVHTRSAGPKSRLDQFIDSRETKRFVGRPISLQVREADLADVFRLIGEASGFNIILGDSIKGNTISVSMTDVPWDHALDVILHTKKLGAERFGNVLRIVQLSALEAEKQAELKAKLAAEANTPKVTRIFPISYADLSELSNELQKFATVSQAATTGGVTTVASGVVQVDNRTNSIIVRDIPDNIERVRKLIEVLDTQTPQVIIEAKIIEAGEEFSRGFSGSFAIANDVTGNSAYAASAIGGNPLDQLFSGTGPFTTGSSIATLTPKSGTAIFSPTLGIFPGLLKRLNFQLSAQDSDAEVKVVASPKTVVLNKQSADITQTTPVFVPTTVTTTTGTLQTTTVQDAQLNLKVTPTVTNDGGVLLDLALTRDVPETKGDNSAISKRNMHTKVLVPSGSTLVIGGIYISDHSESSYGVPFLRKIPLIGWLFGASGTNDTRRELLFFVSPRILNLREAGLQG